MRYKYPSYVQVMQHFRQVTISKYGTAVRHSVQGVKNTVSTCPGVHLSKTSYFVCGTSVSLCLLVQRIIPLHIFLDKQYFQFYLAQKGQEELKVGQGKENTVLPTGQVHLNLLLLPPWLSLDNNTSTWEVGDHIREVLDELLPPVFLSTSFNYKSLAS